MLNRLPVSVRSGVLDYISKPDDYVENYEQIARDDLAEHLMPDEVKDCLACLVDVWATGDRILDVGCAYGHILGKVTAKCRVGVDISQAYLERLPPDILRVRCNAEVLPFSPGTFDTVICTDVFEHVQDSKALAAELLRVMKPGGRLLLATPWEQDLSVYDHPEYPKKYKYVHLRSVNDQVIGEHFGGMVLKASTFVTQGMKYQKWPYPIRFMVLE